MSASSDDIIRHIIRDIVARASTILKFRRGESQPSTVAEPGPDGSAGTQQAAEPGHVTETLAAFMVRAVVLDPRNEFKIERELGKDEVDRLIKICVGRITELNSPVMETVKMQVYFDSNFPAQGDFLHKEKQSHLNACAPLLREITDVKTKAIAVYEALYRKIVSYLLLRSHVGSPMDMRVVREATAALESVFPQSELSTFISLARQEKEAQLNGLAQLITGIRLFNKQLGKGGEGVDDLPTLCIQHLGELKETLKTLTVETEELIQTYMAVIDYADKSNKPDIGDLSLPRLRSALVFRREFLIYLDALHEQTTRAEDTLKTLSERFEEAVRDLKVTCRAKTAVPVDQVYPQFIQLANLWQGYMDELFLLAFRRGIVDTIEGHTKAFTMDIPPITIAMSQLFKRDIEPEIMPEQKVIAKASEMMTALAVAGIRNMEVIHPGNTTQYYRLPVEYGGFCPYTLITRDGLVVPGDKNLGLLRYRDKLYAFASEEGMKDFTRSPDRFIENVLDIAKRAPELVQMLHLYPYFPTVEALENARSFTRQRLLGHLPLVSEIGTQVDTHIVDTWIDPKYEWNEWELRRKALMYVNLRTKATHSAQTDLSHFRRESESQKWEMKTKPTQTLRNSSTSTPRKVAYYANLRHATGRDVSTTPRFRVLDLTVDLDGKPAPYGGGGFGEAMTAEKAATAGVGRVVRPTAKVSRAT